MNKHRLHIFVLLITSIIVFAHPASAQFVKLQGFCEDGNQPVVTSGLSSTTLVQRSYPLCTVTVFNQGTVTLSTIYSNSTGTSQPNPFTAAADGQWTFYAAVAHYDVQFSGAGITTPFTRGDWVITSSPCAYASNQLRCSQTNLSPFDIQLDTLGATANVSVGSGNLLSVISGGGINNTAIGFQALAADNAGSSNTAVGHKALAANVGSVNGNQNTAVGDTALLSNTEGFVNTAVGYQALNLNTTGNTNVAVGALAMFSALTGVGNTSIGYKAMQLNVSGIDNVGVGTQSLNGTTGNNNVAVGFNAGILPAQNCSPTQCSNNTFIGFQAGNFAGSSGAAITGNIFLGANAGTQELSSNNFVVDNQSRGSQTASRNSALMWGVMDPLASNQTLNVNATFDVWGATVQFASATANGSAVLFTPNSGGGFTTIQSSAAGAGTINPIMIETPGLTQYFAMNQSKPGQTIPANSTKAWMFEGLDGNLTSLVIDGYGTGNPGRASITGRKARGTAAAPSALSVQNETIFSVEAQGFGATGYSTTGRGAMIFATGQPWTDTAQGTYVTFSTTTNGGTSQTVHMTLEDGLLLGNVGGGGPAGNDKGDGTINISGAYYVNNNLIANSTGTVNGVSYTSSTVCNSPAGTCTSAPAGSVTIAAAATTVVVATTAVTAISQIFIQEDDSLGTRLGVTCNTTAATRLYEVTARSAGTSFTITSSAAPAVNPACLSYWIVN